MEGVRVTVVGDARLNRMLALNVDLIMSLDRGRHNRVAYVCLPIARQAAFRTSTLRPGT
jgi:hypothetical protein